MRNFLINAARNMVVFLIAATPLSAIVFSTLAVLAKYDSLYVGIPVMIGYAVSMWVTMHYLFKFSTQIINLVDRWIK